VVVEDVEDVNDDGEQDSIFGTCAAAAAATTGNEVVAAAVVVIVVVVVSIDDAFVVGDEW